MDVEPLSVVYVGGVSQQFWQGEGGQAPSYKINDNATLTVYRGDKVHAVLSPSAWAMVKGPEKKARAGLLN